MIETIERWLGRPIGLAALLITVTFAASAAAAGALSWWAGLAITVAVALLPPFIHSGWLDHQPTRWSTSTAASAVAGAALVFGITVLSAMAGALALLLVLVTYIGGRQSN
jgi:hypothetical protein